MPLSPEDVVSKRFNSTKFREGYDQDEVDDFLDEVVVELRRLNAENDELRQRLVASEARVNELQAGGDASFVAPAAPVVVEPTPEPVVEVVEQTPEPEPEPVASTPDAVPSSVDPDSSTNDLLKLARRLHDQHVQEGIEKRDSLISEGHSTASRLVSDAQEQSRVQLGRLEEQKSRLETSIDQLRSFESEYRTRLKSYIEGQLQELTSSADTVAPGSTPETAGTGAGASTPSAVAAPTAFASAATSPAAQPVADRSGVSGTA